MRDPESAVRCWYGRIWKFRREKAVAASGVEGNLFTRSITILILVHL
jgi:hypothetical protein